MSTAANTLPQSKKRNDTTELCNKQGGQDRSFVPWDVKKDNESKGPCMLTASRVSIEFSSNVTKG